MQGIVFNNEVINIFKTYLLEGKIYWFHGVRVILADKKYRMVPHQYQLLFTITTKIEKMVDDCNKFPCYKYNLIKFQDLSRYSNCDTHLIGNIKIYFSNKKFNVIICDIPHSYNKKIYFVDVVGLVAYVSNCYRV